MWKRVVRNCTIWNIKERVSVKIYWTIMLAHEVNSVKIVEEIASSNTFKHRAINQL